MDAIPIFMAAIIFAAIMLTRTIIQNIPKNPADAVVDIGMERWHQQDLAAWDALFEREVGRRPFPPAETVWPGKLMMMEGSFNQLLAPGLNQAFQQQQGALQNLGMGIGGIMAQQAQQGLFNLQQAQALAQQQQALAAHEAFCEAARLDWLRDRGDIN